MTTMAQAIKRIASAEARRMTSDQIREAIKAEHPGRWKDSTLQAHLYACAVNQPKAYIHHPSTEKFLYRNADGTFELYSEQQHGPNEWVPHEGDDDVSKVEELVETSISLERDIEDHLVSNLDCIEPGLQMIGGQVNTDVGRVDILAQDVDGNRVVIEVKVGEAKDSAIGQTARYLGWYAQIDGKAARGILIAAEFPDGVKYAASAVENLKLLSYRVQFSFEEAKI